MAGEIVWGPAPDGRCNRQLYLDPGPQRLARTYTDLAGVMPSLESNKRWEQRGRHLRRRFDCAHEIFLEQACNALEDAGADPFNDMMGQKTGVYVGHTGGSSRIGDLVYATGIGEAARLLYKTRLEERIGSQRTQRLVTDLTAAIRQRYGSRGMDEIQSYGAVDCARIVQQTLELDGPAAVFDAACASGLQALAVAVRALRAGRIEQAIVGAVSHFKVDSLVLFSAAHSVSRTGSFPFCADADGLVTSEGQVALVLKPLSLALRDGNRIRAVIEGIGMSCDGKGKSLWAPRSEGQLLAMNRAYPDPAHIQTLGYIEAHATGTQVGDATELRALDSLLTHHLPTGERLLVGSLKTNIGHTLETAGLASLVKVILAMEHGWIPPGSADREPNPALADMPYITVPHTPVQWPDKLPDNARRGAVNAFGIGGINVHVVLSRGLHEGTTHSAHREKRPAVAIVGAECLLPGCKNKTDFLDRVARGKSAVIPVPSGRWSLQHDSSKALHQPFRSLLTQGGYIQDYSFDWRAFRIPPIQLASANPLQYMLIEAVDRVLKSCGPVNPQTTAVLVGTSFGGDFSNELQMGLRLPETLCELNTLLSQDGVDPNDSKDLLADYQQQVLTRYPALQDETGSFTASSLATRIAKVFNFMGGAFSLDAGMHTTAMVLSAAEDLLTEEACDTVICALGQRHMDLFAYEGISRELSNRIESKNGSLEKDLEDTIFPAEGTIVFIIKRAKESSRGTLLSDISIRSSSISGGDFTITKPAQPCIGHLGAADAALSLLTYYELGTAGTVDSEHAGSRSEITLKQKGDLQSTGKVAALFPGQGSQYEDCFKSLVSRSGIAAEVMADLNAMTDCLDLPTLAETAWRKDHLMGIQVWDTQWAVFLGDLFAWKLLQRLGVRVDCLAGHSFGEFPMAVAGGALTFREGALASKARATALRQEAANAGGLISLLMDADGARQLIQETHESLWISAINAPRQVVVGGTHEALDKLESTCDQKRLACRRLAVASPFHTPLLNQAAEFFKATIDRLSPKPWSIPAFSATTAAAMQTPHTLKENLVLQLTQPVRWVETVQRLYDEGVRTFIEVGPAGVLSGLVKQTLRDRSDIEVIALDQPPRDGIADPLDLLRNRLANAGLLQLNPIEQRVQKQGVIERFDASSVRRSLNRKRSSRVEDEKLVIEDPAPQNDPSQRIEADKPETMSRLRRVILDFVVEHTGYPVEMIDFSVDLEADLGIDSIRKAQLISDLGVQFDIKREPGLALADFVRLRDIEEFFEKRIPASTLARKTEARSINARSHTETSIYTELDLVTSQNASADGRGYLLCCERAANLELGREIGALSYWFLKRNGKIVLAWNEAGLLLAEREMALDSMPWTRRLQLPTSTGLETILSNVTSLSDIASHEKADGRTVYAADLLQADGGLWTTWQERTPQTRLARFAEDEFSGDWGTIINELLTDGHRKYLRASELSAAGRWVAFGMVKGKMLVTAGDGMDPEWTSALTTKDPHSQRNVAPPMPLTQRYTPLLLQQLKIPKGSRAQAGPITVLGTGEAARMMMWAAGKSAVSRPSLAEAETNSDSCLLIADRIFLETDHVQPFSGRDVSLEPWISHLQKWLDSIGETKDREHTHSGVLAIVNLGGDLGISGRPCNMKGAALMGLFKGLAKEYPHVSFRTVDIGDQTISEGLSRLIVQELNRPERFTEVALSEQGRWVLGLRAQDRCGPEVPPEPDGVWLVTGGASGITAECAFELAKRHRLKMALIGRTSIEMPTDGRGHGTRDQREDSKHARIHSCLRRYRDAGLNAQYFSCDLSKSDDIEKTIAEVEHRLGPIQGIIHGAGIEHSARFSKKSISSFEATVQPKSLALSSMIEVLRSRGTLDSLKRLVAFGSTSGHFGGHGQADYSLANQLLARLVARLRHDQPNFHATCIHWHAWDGVGMATRDGIPLILEQFGLKLMPLQEGLEHFLSETESGTSPAEIVITEPTLVAASYYGETAREAFPPLLSSDPGSPQRQQITLDPRTHPFLSDHRLDGVSLLPAAMAAELILQSAYRSATSSKNFSLIDFEILKAVMVTDGRTSNLEIRYDESTFSIALHQDGSLNPCIKAKLSTRDDSLNSFPSPTPCPFPLYPTVYFENSTLRHGVTLRALKGTYFERNGGWAELIAPDPAAVLGQFQSEKIHTPVALLDGCFYACGLYAHFLCGQRIERPVGIKRLTVWSDAKADEPCSLRFALIDQTPTYSLYDIQLFNREGNILIEVEHLRMGCFS